MVEFKYVSSRSFTNLSREDPDFLRKLVQAEIVLIYPTFPNAESASQATERVQT